MQQTNKTQNDREKRKKAAAEKLLTAVSVSGGVIGFCESAQRDDGARAHERGTRVADLHFLRASRVEAHRSPTGTRAGRRRAGEARVHRRGAHAAPLGLTEVSPRQRLATWCQQVQQPTPVQQGLSLGLFSTVFDSIGSARKKRERVKEKSSALLQHNMIIISKWDEDLMPQSLQKCTFIGCLVLLAVGVKLYGHAAIT